MVIAIDGYGCMDRSIKAESISCTKTWAIVDGDKPVPLLHEIPP